MLLKSRVLSSRLLQEILGESVKQMIWGSMLTFLLVTDDYKFLRNGFVYSPCYSIMSFASWMVANTAGVEIFMVENFRNFVCQCITWIFHEFYFSFGERPLCSACSHVMCQLNFMHFIFAVRPQLWKPQKFLVLQYIPRSIAHLVASLQWHIYQCHKNALEDCCQQ